MAAARAWLTGDRQAAADRDLAESMAAFGASAAYVAACLPPRAAFRLWPQNRPAWEAFLAVCHQWRLSPQGQAVALDYAQAEAGWRLAGVAMDPALFGQVRLIEAAVVEALQEAGGV